MSATTTLSYKNDHDFWQTFCEKAKNWGVGPMRTYTNYPGVEVRREAEAQEIYVRYKNREAEIPSRYESKVRY